MRRRRYLQTTALALTSGLAGCSEFGTSGDGSTSTETPEPTATPTETPEPTPRDEPRGVDAPLYMDLLPRLQMKGPDGEGEYGSDNAVFTKVDWEWYLQMPETVPKFGPTSDEAWSFRPSQGNFMRAPSADILKTPVYEALTVTNLLEGELSLNFENLAPVLLEQLGLQAEEGEREATWVIDEAILVLSTQSNGARRRFGENPHADRSIEPIEPFDTLMFGMDISEYAGTVQAIVSDFDGGAPEAEALGEAFAEPAGEYGTRYHPNVSTISAS